MDRGGVVPLKGLCNRNPVHASGPAIGVMRMPFLGRRAARSGAFMRSGGGRTDVEMESG